MKPTTVANHWQLAIANITDAATHRDPSHDFLFDIETLNNGIWPMFPRALDSPECKITELATDLLGFQARILAALDNGDYQQAKELAFQSLREAVRLDVATGLRPRRNRKRV